MRTTLSFQNIAGALAALGTSAALVACGGSDKPAEVPTTSSETAAPKAVDPLAAAPVPNANPETAAAPIAPAATTSAAPAAPSAKPVAPATSAKPGTPAPAKKGGAASCGAGTCSAKK